MKQLYELEQRAYGPLFSICINGVFNEESPCPVERRGLHFCRYEINNLRYALPHSFDYYKPGRN